MRQRTRPTERSRRLGDDAGLSLVEVTVAAGLFATSLVTLAQLFAVGTNSNISSRSITYAAVLAQQKLEELRSLAWGFDVNGAPVADLTTNTALEPVVPDGGTGLSISPGATLTANTDGYVDYIDQFGRKLGGGALARKDAVYFRRWSIDAAPGDPANTLVLQVLVTRNAGGPRPQEAAAARRDEARVATLKTRKGR